MATNPAKPSFSARKPVRRRVKRFYLSVGRSRRLEVSLRRFRTRQDRRSKRKQQLVFAVDVVGFREVAIVLSRRKRPKKPSHRIGAVASRYIWPHREALAPAVLIMVGLLSSAYFGSRLEKPVNLSLVSDTSQAASVQPTEARPAEQSKSMPRSDPTSIRIPKIEIDTTLVPVGIEPSTGQLAPPDGFDIAGWYDQGPTPGEIGPATIAGHVDSPHNIAIFWRLRELLPGDRVEISRLDGTVASFTVTDIKQFPQDQFPTEEVYGKIDYAGLRLITCGGTFSSETGHYSHNTVVYARLE